MIEEEPATGFIETLLSFSNVAEGLVGVSAGFLRSEALRAETFFFELDVGLDFGREVGGFAIASKHSQFIPRGEAWPDRSLRRGGRESRWPPGPRRPSRGRPQPEPADRGEWLQRRPQRGHG